MIYSMTAFARTQSADETNQLVCEIRSINHRYLDISLYLPDMLRAFEMPIRERIKTQLKRGKIECVMKYQQIVGGNSSQLKINTKLAKDLCVASETIATFLKNPAPVNPTDLLRFPGVYEIQEEEKEHLQIIILDLLEKTLGDLVLVRGREGEELKHLFLQRVNLMSEELINAKERLPQVIGMQAERLQKRFYDAKLDLDPLRLEQEMVLFAQKIDVSEEIDRIETHLAEIRRILTQGGMVGRRLDFLLQELNREANTLGSKSTDSVMTHAALEMKVLIEQIREQVQNIE